MQPRYTGQTISKSNITLLQVLVATFLLFSSSVLFAAENINTPIGLSQTDRQEETINTLETSSLINAYIIVPIKLVDSIVTEAIAILMPIKGAVAEPIDQTKKKSLFDEDVMKEVQEAIKGAYKNINEKNRGYTFEGMKAAAQGQAQINAINRYISADQEFKNLLNAPLFGGLSLEEDPEYIKIKSEYILKYASSNSETIKEFYASHPPKLKELFERIINSDLSQEIKEKAQELLFTINLGVAINHGEVMELIKATINGSAAYILCETGCAVVAGLTVGSMTGGVGVIAGINAGIIECGPLCSQVAIAVGVTGARNNHENVHFSQEDTNVAHSERIVNPTKTEGKVWQELKSYKRDIKTNGLSGKDKEYYKWDKLHNDIEVYDRNGKHLGSKDPTTGQMYKPAKTDRNIKEEL